MNHFQMFAVSSTLFLMMIPISLQTNLRIMTFNIWNSGRNVDNGLEKIAAHIKHNEPDIVALQEVEHVEVLRNLTHMLGRGWEGAINDNVSYPDTAILTKHNIHFNSITFTYRGTGAKISLNSGELIVFWCVHLDYKSYGPYAAQNKLVTRIDQIMAGERPSQPHGRYYDMREVQQNDKMQKWLSKVDQVPIIMAGDFNAPSHLDWTNETADIHGGWVVEWPATKLVEDMGFTDSYRHLHPDIKNKTGYTWSTVNKFNPEWEYTIEEPQDRIDFIFHQGSLRPIQSVRYSGTQQLKPIPNHKSNDYPSDHYAAINSLFVMMLQRLDMNRRLGTRRKHSMWLGNNYTCTTGQLRIMPNFYDFDLVQVYHTEDRPTAPEDDQQLWLTESTSGEFYLLEKVVASIVHETFSYYDSPKFAADSYGFDWGAIFRFRPKNTVSPDYKIKWKNYEVVYGEPLKGILFVRAYCMLRLLFGRVGLKGFTNIYKYAYSTLDDHLRRDLSLAYPASFDSVNFIKVPTITSDGRTSHAALGYFNALNQTITVYDGGDAREGPLSGTMRMILLANYGHLNGTLRAGYCKYYSQQPETWCCAYYSMFACLGIMNRVDPGHYEMNSMNMFQIAKWAIEEKGRRLAGWKLHEVWNYVATKKKFTSDEPVSWEVIKK